MNSDTLDALDRRVLQALDIAGRAPFSRIGAVLGVSDQTVARRYRRLRELAGLRIVAVRDGTRLGEDSWLLRLRCTPDAAEPLARALARRRRTAWIGLASGGTEVVGMTLPRSRDEHDELILGRLPRTPSIVEIRAHQMLHRFYGGPTGWLSKRDYLTPGEIAALAPPAADPAGPPPVLTPEDDRLIAALEQDGRASVEELRRATGRTESSVRRALDQLLASGALFIDVQFDSAAIGHDTRAVLWITTAPAALDEVGRAVATHPEVAFVSATAGHCNLVAVVVCADTADVYRYVSGRLGSLPGVQHIDSAPILRTVKQLTYEETHRARS
ncbi:Lrp/AsnC family transcriptional regulator [Streptomyces sp. NPDC050504]|uniref:Lrp/AsnC family transcriptional regulator n=1 Tax=Streptomyces sp. NPDC050504 TaxID=3365618 RepID=UPI0037B0D1A0